MLLTPSLLRQLVDLLAPVLSTQDERAHYIRQAFRGDPVAARLRPDHPADPRHYASALLDQLDRDPCRRTADGRDSRVVYLTVIADEKRGDLATALAPIIAQLAGADGPPPAAQPPAAAGEGLRPSAQRASPGVRPPLTKSRLAAGENGGWIERNQERRERNLILFVHGYTGSTDATWQKFPDLLLRADQGFYDGYEVGSFGYDTHFVVNRESLAKLSAQLASWLEAHAVGVENVFLVTHSLGGIVARALLVDVCDSPGHAVLYGKIAQVHFIASPQEGAPLPGGIARWLRFFNPLAWELRRDSPLLAELLDRWLDFAATARAKSRPLPELYHYLGSKDWVASYERFANGRLAATEEFNVVDSDHTTLVKPVTTASTVYTLVAQRIRARGGGMAGAPPQPSDGPPAAAEPTDAAPPNAAPPTAPPAAPAIDPATAADIARLIADQSDGSAVRRALLLEAFFGHDLATDIEVERRSAKDYAYFLMEALQRHGDLAPGEPALRRLLTTLRKRYGIDKQAWIDGIVGRLWP